ncbi:MAG: hypothetical protein EBS77_06830, partial [Gammaproteobacteria bacterium]|nr:hypothetical protein [Gammaproteobacteria bacterium]
LQVSDNSAQNSTVSQILSVHITGSDPTRLQQIGETQNADEGGAVVEGTLSHTITNAIGQVTYTLIGEPVAGLTLDTNGNWSFDPKHNAYDSLSEGEEKTIFISYRAIDTNNASSDQTIKIVIKGTNDSPIATTIESLTNEDRATYSIDLLSNVNDPDTTEFTVSPIQTTATDRNGLQVAVPEGTLSLSGSTLMVNPGIFNNLSNDDSITISFNYSIDDGYSQTNATAQIVIQGVNDRPVVTSITAPAASESDPFFWIDLLSGVTDADTSDILTINNLSSAAITSDGQLTVIPSEALVLNGNSLRVDPAAFASLGLKEGKNIAITTRYQVSDGVADVVNTASFTITGINNPLLVSPIDAGTRSEISSPFTLDLLSGVRSQDKGSVLSIQAAPTISATDGNGNAYSLPDGAVVISADHRTASINPTSFSNLNDNDAVTVILTYSISGGSNSSAANTATFTITGQTYTNSTATISSNPFPFAVDASGGNSIPVIAAVDIEGEIIESNKLSDSGSFNYTDLDADQTHVATASVVSIKDETGTELILASDLQDALVEGLTIALIPATPGSGTVNWSYSIADEEIKHLGRGEELNLTFSIALTDSAGGSSSEAIQIRIIGTNDTPQILEKLIENFKEDDDNLSASGNAVIIDVDTIDDVTASAGAVTLSGSFIDAGRTLPAELLANNSLALLQLMQWNGQSGLEDLESNSPNGSLINWSFNGGQANTLFNFLAEGETLTLTYQLNLTDNSANRRDDIASENRIGEALDIDSLNYQDTETGQLYLNTKPSGKTGDALQWRITKPFDQQESEGISETTWVTPLIFEKVGDEFIIRGIGRSRALTNSGTYTFDFDLVSGSSSMANSNYTYGHIDRDINSISSQAVVSSQGSIGYTDAGIDAGTWGSSNLAIESDQEVSIDSRFMVAALNRAYASELILAADESVTQSVDAVSITITGTNGAPEIVVNESIDPPSAQLTETDIPVTASGSVGIRDEDFGDVVNAQLISASIDGEAPSWLVGEPNLQQIISQLLEISPSEVIDGSTNEEQLYWRFNSGHLDLDKLSKGELITFRYTVRIFDAKSEDTQDIIVEIEGTNDRPTITAFTGTSEGRIDLTEKWNEQSGIGDPLTASGTIDLSDSDEGDQITVERRLQRITADGGALITNELSVALTDALTLNQQQDTKGKFNWLFSLNGDLVSYLSEGENIIVDYRVEFDDGQGVEIPKDGNELSSIWRDLRVIISGSNAQPEIQINESAGDSSSVVVVEGNETISANGTLTVQDIDYNDSLRIKIKSASSSIDLQRFGFSSDFSLQQEQLKALLSTSDRVLTDGLATQQQLSWEFNSSDYFFNALNKDEELSLSYTIDISDRESSVIAKEQILTITLIGSNDTPQVLPAPATEATENSTSISGNLEFTDFDDQDTITYFLTGAQIPGFNLNTDGTWTFDPSNTSYDPLTQGESKTITIAYEAEDSHGGSAPGLLEIKILGANDLPTAIALEPQAVIEGDSIIQGQIESIDLDSGATATYILLSDNISGLTFEDDGSWSFNPADPAYDSLTDGQQQTITVNYTVTDNNGGVTNSSFSINLSGTNDAPLLRNIPNLAVVEDGGLQQLDLSNLEALAGPDTAIDETAQTLSLQVTALPPAEAGTLYLADGITPVAINTPYTLNQLQSLSFRPADNYNGDANFSITVTDTATDGALTSAPYSINLRVLAVNDAPERTAGFLQPLIISNEQALDGLPLSLNLEDLAYNTGPDDEADQTLTIRFSTLPAGNLGQVLLADGITPVAINTDYSVDQLNGLLFRPWPG